MKISICLLVNVVALAIIVGCYFYTSIVTFSVVLPFMIFVQLVAVIIQAILTVKEWRA